MLSIAAICGTISNPHGLLQIPKKRKQETQSLLRVPDSFRKIIVTRDYITPRHDDNGILYLGVEQFLTDASLIEL